jgi:hypothetical protein
MKLPYRLGVIGLLKSGPTYRGEMNDRTRLLMAGAALAGLSSLTQLLFVITKLPVIFWSDLMGGVFAAAVTAILFVLLRGQLRRTHNEPRG